MIVRIADNGKAHGAPGADDHVTVSEPGAGGYGIRGMRERASLLGGSLRAGTATDGGFVVEAVLPVQEPT